MKMGEFRKLKFPVQYIGYATGVPHTILALSFAPSVPVPSVPVPTQVASDVAGVGIAPPSIPAVPFAANGAGAGVAPPAVPTV